MDGGGVGVREGAAATTTGRVADGRMTQQDMLAKAARFEAEAVALHGRSQAARSPIAATILRFRALWKEEAARLLRRNMG